MFTTSCTRTTLFPFKKTFWKISLTKTEKEDLKAQGKASWHNVHRIEYGSCFVKPLPSPEARMKQLLCCADLSNCNSLPPPSIHLENCLFWTDAELKELMASRQALGRQSFISRDHKSLSRQAQTRTQFYYSSQNSAFIFD